MGNTSGTAGLTDGQLYVALGQIGQIFDRVCARTMTVDAARSLVQTLLETWADAENGGPATVKLFPNNKASIVVDGRFWHSDRAHVWTVQLYLLPETRSVRATYALPNAESSADQKRGEMRRSRSTENFPRRDGAEARRDVDGSAEVRREPPSDRTRSLRREPPVPPSPHQRLPSFKESLRRNSRPGLPPPSFSRPPSLPGPVFTDRATYGQPYQQPPPIDNFGTDVIELSGQPLYR